MLKRRSPSSSGFNKTCRTVTALPLFISILPHQTYWLDKVIGQPAIFPLNRPWNWLCQLQYYYLSGMKAQQQDDGLFSSSVIQTHLDYDDGQTTRCSQLLDPFLSSLNWTKWNLTLWKFSTTAFFPKTHRDEIWSLKTGRCGWAREKKRTEEERYFNK